MNDREKALGQRVLARKAPVSDLWTEASACNVLFARGGL
jgi:hypothetical protein